MTRIAVILCAFAMACDVGDASHLTDGGPKRDGMGSDSGNGCVPMMTPASPHLHATGGTSNAGKDCMTAGGCHGASPGAGGAFAYAGTMYTTTGGTTPAGGVTVQVKAGGMTYASAATDTDGNFYEIQSFTITGGTTDVTSCPTVKSMQTGLQAGNGACNGCHAVGGTQATIGLQ